MNRKQFLQSGTILSAGLLLQGACTNNLKKIGGKIIGANAQVGHLLRDNKIPFTTPEVTEKKKIVIVGGGVSGLSAARFLFKQNERDFVVLDLEKDMGGNAAYGSNEVSKYPWGAHYIPIPNNDLTEYLHFLQECNVITGYKDGLPTYNEQYLCFDPQERLYINGHWQDGLVPQYGVPKQDLQQIQSFLQLVDDLRYKKGNDGKDAFAIPVNNSSKDEIYTALDNITMQKWLQQNGFTSEYLHWYVNYCMRDDFGTPIDIISAWTGLHYYAARKGKAANAAHDDVLTWQQGNGWMAAQLEKGIEDKLFNNHLVLNIKQNRSNLLVSYYDVQTKRIKAYETEQCIVAVPQFVAARLLNDSARIEKIKRALHYTPWMVANITTSALEERSGAPLCWDNVLYGSDALGYVNATQQMLQQHIPVRNFTYYKPLTEEDCNSARLKAYKTTHEQWTADIMKDLKVVHPNIEQKVSNIDIMIWGHAMAQPLPGIAHGNLRIELAASINNNVHFAHTDLAGISIFEEAFYQGLHAAENALKQLA